MSDQSSSYHRALTIAGSDSGGGAGIQADLKTFHSLGVYGMTVITALTAQNTRGVQGIYDVDPSFIARQFESVLSDIGCDGVKTGMLSTPGVIREVAKSIRRFRIGNLVVDPVMVAKGGARLLREDAVSSLVEDLLPLSLIVTPNAEEAAILADRAVNTVEEMKDAARTIHSLGPRYVLVKGGHVDPEGTTVHDVLFGENGALEVFESKRVDARHTHGTGCTLSAAITGHLALGRPVREAVARGRDYLTGALRAAKPLGQGIGPVNHLWQWEAGVES